MILPRNFLLNTTRQIAVQRHAHVGDFGHCMGVHGLLSSGKDIAVSDKLCMNSYPLRHFSCHTWVACAFDAEGFATSYLTFRAETMQLIRQLLAQIFGPVI